MKIVFDETRRALQGLCVDACPEVFEIDEHDRLVVLLEEPHEALRDKVLDAERRCPTRAINVEE